MYENQNPQATREEMRSLRYALNRNTEVQQGKEPSAGPVVDGLALLGGALIVSFYEAGKVILKWLLKSKDTPREIEPGDITPPIGTPRETEPADIISQSGNVTVYRKSSLPQQIREYENNKSLPVNIPTKITAKQNSSNGMETNN